MNAWLLKNGCVPINHLMEDAATAEIARTQLWQWVYHHVSVENATEGPSSKVLTPEYFLEILKSRLTVLKDASKSMHMARDILEKLVLSKECPDFLTLECYPHICSLPLNSKL